MASLKYKDPETGEWHKIGLGSGGSSGGFVAQPEAPADPNVLWLDTDDDEEDTGGASTADKVTVTDETAALFGLGEDATVDDALGVLSEAAFVKKVPQYTQVSLGGLAEGSIIQLNENGSPVDFYVAKHNYEADLNGEGRTLLVRKDCYDQRNWSSTGKDVYATSTIDTWLNGDYKALLDADIQTRIGETEFYYTVGDGDKTVTTLSRSVFLLSITELGKTYSYANTEGSALPIASTLQVAYLNGSAVLQWARTPNITSTTKNFACCLSATGDADTYNCGYDDGGSRPAFTLPTTDILFIDDDGVIHAEQAYVISVTDIDSNVVVAQTLTYTATVTDTWTEDTTNGGFTQTVAVDGILSADNPTADIVMGDDVEANALYADAWSLITRIVTADGSVTLYANKEAPATAFTMQLKGGAIKWARH